MDSSQHTVSRLPQQGGIRRATGHNGSLVHSSPGSRWIKPYILPVVVTILAFGLYLHRLDKQSFWCDELGTIARSGWQGSWWDAIIGPLTIPGPAKPPLPFLLTHLCLLLGDQVFLLRLPAALFATLSIPATYALGRALFAGQGRVRGHSKTRSTQISLLGALLLALAPLQIRYAQELRMYAMWVFLSTLCLYFYWRAIRTGAKSWWAAFALASLLALYTHSFTLLYLAVLALFGLWLLARPSNREQFPFRAWQLIAALTTSLLAYAPMAPFLLKGLGSGEGLVTDPARNWDLTSSLLALRLFSGGHSAGAILCTGLVLVAVVVLASRAREVLLIAALWIMLPACLLIILPFGHRLWVRYFLCALPVYLLLVAYGLLAFSEWLSLYLARSGGPSSWVNVLATVILAGILLLTSTASISLYYTETKQNWRDATYLLCSLADPDEPIYVRHWYYQAGVRYYAKQNANSGCVLAESDIQTLPRDLAEAFPPNGTESRWLVVPATPRFLPGGQVEGEIQSNYRYLEPSIFPPAHTPKEAAIISPLMFRGVAVIQVVPNEPASICFWAEETELAPGDCTLLRWKVDHVREVYLEGRGVVGHDLLRVCPQVTTRYVLKVIHRDETATTHTVEIEIHEQ